MTGIKFSQTGVRHVSSRRNKVQEDAAETCRSEQDRYQDGTEAAPDPETRFGHLLFLGPGA